MTNDLLMAFAAFAFVSSITPGPNNLMLLASGANFGFARSIPHMLGVGIGFMLMVFLVGVGIMGLFEAWPASFELLRVLSIAYLLYLALRIATTRAPLASAESGDARPLGFVQAALFQWVNPKGWTMALTAISVYSPDRSLQAVLTVALVFGLINLPAVSTWAVLGLKLRKLLRDPSRLRAFNVVMALLLLGSVYPVL